MERKLLQMGMNPGECSPLDRLRYVGQGGMGALTYTPAIENFTTSLSDDLDDIAHKVYQLQEHDDAQCIDELLAMNGSSAGARPKIVININDEAWLIKFRSSIDPSDMGSIEYAYHLMAKEAGIEVPEAKLFPSKKSSGYFGVKRFDRVKDQRIHMHTVSGLLHIDHRLPSLDYENIMKVTAWLSKEVRECEKQFRVAVFNVLSHNRDDHAKNFSFLMDAKGKWRVSPAYDLTFSSGPSGEHCSMIMGEGKHPSYDHLIALADIASIEKKQAESIIDEVKNAVAKWTFFATQAGVSHQWLTIIQKTIYKLGKNNE